MYMHPDEFCSLSVHRKYIMEVGLLFQLLAVDAECRHRARTRICRMQNVEVIMQSESPKYAECRCRPKLHNQEMRDVYELLLTTHFWLNVVCGVAANITYRISYIPYMVSCTDGMLICLYADICICCCCCCLGCGSYKSCIFSF